MLAWLSAKIGKIAAIRLVFRQRSWGIKGGHGNCRYFTIARAGLWTGANAGGDPGSNSQAYDLTDYARIMNNERFINNIYLSIKKITTSVIVPEACVHDR